MTTVDYLTQLQQDREDLVDNLEAQGITGLTGDETFTELVSEVLNIPSGADLSDYFKEYLQSGSSSISGLLSVLTKIPETMTLRQSATSMAYMFYRGEALMSIHLFDTSEVINMNYAFSSCANLTSIPLYNTQNVKTMQGTFGNCTGLTSFPQLNTSSLTDARATLMGCTNLTTIPKLDFSKIVKLNDCFLGCSSLTTLGGFENLGQGYQTNVAANDSNYKIDLSSCELLIHDSLMNVINNLYDIATKGCATQSLVLGATNLAKLSSAEISAGTNKGWSIS